MTLRFQRLSRALDLRTFVGLWLVFGTGMYGKRRMLCGKLFTKNNPVFEFSSR